VATDVILTPLRSAYTPKQAASILVLALATVMEKLQRADEKAVRKLIFDAFKLDREEIPSMSDLVMPPEKNAVTLGRGHSNCCARHW